MRPVAVSGGGRVDDGGVLLVIHPLEDVKRRMGVEETIELQGSPLARAREGKLAMQFGVIRVANWRNRREAVERAPQNDDDEPWIARIGRARRRGEEPGAAEDAGRRCARALDEAATGEGRRRSGGSHGHLLWNSGDMNRSASAWSRDSARSIAWRVSSEAVSPSAALMMSSGSARPRMRLPTMAARSSLSFIASGDVQVSLESENPFGPVGCQSGMPSRLSACRYGPGSDGEKPVARAAAP